MLLPRPPFKMPIWHLEHSSRFNRNIKSSGKRSRLRFTCRLSCPTSTPYSSARSRSSMTCTPRIVRIRERMASTPVGSGRHATISLGADTDSVMFFLAISYLFCLVAVRAPAPQPRGATLRAHHARRLAHSKANPQENQCKIFVKACKNFLHRFYTVFTRGDCTHTNAHPATVRHKSQSRRIDPDSHFSYKAMGTVPTKLRCAYFAVNLATKPPPDAILNDSLSPAHTEAVSCR